MIDTTPLAAGYSRHYRGQALPNLTPGQHFTMYGEHWVYLGENDWRRIAAAHGSERDAVDTMDDDEMRGQLFDYPTAPPISTAPEGRPTPAQIDALTAAAVQLYAIDIELAPEVRSLDQRSFHALQEALVDLGQIDPETDESPTFVTSTLALRRHEGRLWDDYRAVCDRIRQSDPFAAFNAMSRADIESYIETLDVDPRTWPLADDLLEVASDIAEAAATAIDYNGETYHDGVSRVLSKLAAPAGGYES